MRRNFAHSLCVCGLAALLTAMTGCSERVQRENVFANTETGLGIFISQDPKTQMYEGKLGYFRHEMFYVPTGKLVVYKPKTNTDDQYVEDGEMSKNDADKVPDVLADIRVGAKKSSTEGNFDLYQRLAVGKHAVESTAASVMLSEEDASTLGPLLNPSKADKAFRAELDKMMETGRLRGEFPEGIKDVASLIEKAALEVSGGELEWNQIRSAGGPMLEQLVTRLRTNVEVP